MSQLNCFTYLVSKFRIFSLLIGWSVCCGSAWTAEFTDEIERNYSLRTLAPLKVANSRGDISIQGWPQDKIRIKFKKRVTADSAEEGKRALEKIEFRYVSTEGHVEISSQYKENSTIGERIQERSNLKSRGDMVIFAPYNLKLSIWSAGGNISLKSWNETVEVRAKGDDVNLDGVKADKVTVYCASCNAFLKNIRSLVRCVGSSGKFSLSQIVSKSVFLETETGTIQLSGVEGNQMYITQAGSISGKVLTGRVECHTKSGAVDLTDVSGEVCGITETGSFSAKIADWRPMEELSLESGSGNIHLALPRSFSAQVDIWSVLGKVQIDFPLEVLNSKVYGPEPANHYVGLIRKGGLPFKVFSESGDIALVKN